MVIVIVMSVYACVCYHLISETPKFHYQDKLLMIGKDANAGLQRYDSFNDLVVLHNLNCW